MGVFYSAARDPIFFAHHANIDRIWAVWRSLGRKDFADPDWLNASFLFYDENAQLVRVRVRDCLNPQQLRYTYQDVDNPWLTSKSARAGTGRPIRPAAEPTFPATIEVRKSLTTTVRRPTGGKGGDVVEVLVVDGIEFDRTVYTKFDVYVNASSDEVMKGHAVAECAGSFAHVPFLRRQGKGKNKMQTCLRLG
ncbi:DUF_B2219 domain-containing protein, partial [Cutibacterium acnes]